MPTCWKPVLITLLEHLLVIQTSAHPATRACCRTPHHPTTTTPPTLPDRSSRPLFLYCCYCRYSLCAWAATPSSACSAPWPSPWPLQPTWLRALRSCRRRGMCDGAGRGTPEGRQAGCSSCLATLLQLTMVSGLPQVHTGPAQRPCHARPRPCTAQVAGQQKQRARAPIGKGHVTCGRLCTPPGHLGREPLAPCLLHPLHPAPLPARERTRPPFLPPWPPRAATHAPIAAPHPRPITSHPIPSRNATP